MFTKANYLLLGGFRRIVLVQFIANVHECQHDRVDGVSLVRDTGMEILKEAPGPGWIGLTEGFNCWIVDVWHGDFELSGNDTT